MNKEQLLLDKYRSNIYLLAKELLGYEDLTINFHYRYVCSKLNEPRKKNIRLWLIPRGFFKTTLLTITHSISLQLNKPEIRILIVSGVLANAVSMVSAIGNVYLSNQRFRMFFPKWCPAKPGSPETKWTGQEIHIPNRGGRPVMEGTFEAFGPESTLTSRHYDYIKIDDIVTRENSTTRDQMDKIKTFFKAIFPLRDNPDTPIDVIGTRWDDYDLYGELEEDPDIEVIKVPAVLDAVSTFPERYTIEELNSLRTKMGSYLFSCLYLLEPIPQEDAIFKEKWFKYYNLDSTGLHIQREGHKATPIGHCFMSVDGAITEGKNDYSAITVVTTDSDKNIYVLETWYKQVDPITLINEIVRIYFKWSCISCAMQQSIVEKMLSFYLKEKMRKEKFWLNLVPLKENTRQNKEYLIKSLQPWYESGCIFHLESMKGGELEEELVRFPKARRDDVVDSLQMLQETIHASTGVVSKKAYDRNSLYSWKRRLKKVLSEGNFHLGQDTEGYVVNERTY